MSVKEYFEEQLKESNPITPDLIEKFLNKQTFSGGDLVPGDKFVYVMLDRNNGENLELVRMVEREIETVLENGTYINTTASIPRFQL